jgi:hypothetical protein
MSQATIEDIARKLDALANTFAPRLAGIPVLQNSIEALQGEMHSMRDEMRAQLDGLPLVARRPARREAEMTDDNTAINTSLAELRASVADLQRDIVLIKDVLGRLDGRIRKLEEA